MTEQTTDGTHPLPADESVSPAPTPAAESPPHDQARTLRRFVTPPLLPAILVSLTLFLLCAAWAVTSPAGSSPDDDFHLGSIWCANGTSADSCRQVGQGAYVLRADVARAPCFAYQPVTSGGCSYQLDESAVPTRVNDGLYPGLFYHVMRVFVGDDVPLSVIRMRVFNSLVSAVLVGAAIALSSYSVRRALALSWLVTLVPLGVFFIPSTNPSSWVIAGVGTYWAFLLRYLRPGGSGRVVAGAFCVISAGLAAGARADGAAFVVLLTIAVLLLTVRSPRALLTPWLLLPAVIVVGAFGVFLLTGQSAALSGLSPIDLPDRGGLPLLLNNVYGYPSLFVGMFGLGWGLGWLDTPMPPPVGGLVLAATFSLVVLSLRSYWAQKRLVVGLVALTLLALPLLILQRGGNIVGENVQPRYLLPLTIAGLGFLLLAKGSKPTVWTIGRGPLVLITLAVAMANAFALEATLRRFITGIDVLSINLNVAREWWWDTSVSPMAVWAIGSVIGLLAFATLAWAAVSPATNPDDVADGSFS